jgi:hypothetical protein
MTDNQTEIRELYTLFMDCDRYIRNYKHAKHQLYFRKNYNYLERIWIKKFAQSCQRSKMQARNKLVEMFRYDNEHTEVENVLELS